jgi:cysteine desulfurase
MLPYFSSDYGNPSSMHTSGRKAGQALRKARTDVAGILNAIPSEIIFTGSGTESDNMALVGVARAYKSQGNHIVISSIEHKAVLEATKDLEYEGFEVSVVPVDEKGKVDVNECMKLVRETTIIVSIMLANNEIGTIEPVKEIASAIKEFRKQKPLPLMHTDACQAAGALSLDVKELGVDLMTLNGAKMYGPKGTGILYKKTGVQIAPLIVGGEQEMNLRAGTENLPLIIGFAEALKKVEAKRKDESERLSKLRDYFIAQLTKKIPGAILNGHPTERLPNNVHISIPNVEGESMLLMLDTYGIEASTGSACSALDLKPSHVLLAIGQSSEFAHGSIRFSLGRTTTQREIDRVLQVFSGIVEDLRKISALTSEVVCNQK